MSESSPYEEAFEMLQRGRNMRKVGHPADALRFFLRAARLAPGSEAAQQEIKYAREEVQALLALVERFEQGLPQTAMDPQALLKVADVFYRLNRDEEALAATETAVSLDPEDVEALCKLGHRLNLYGQFEASVTVWNRVIALEPEWSCPWSWKGMVLCNMHRYTEALPLLEHAVTLDSNDIAGWTETVRALSALGREEEARAARKRENAARRASGVPQWMPRETEDEE